MDGATWIHTINQPKAGTQPSTFENKKFENCFLATQSE